MLTPFRTNTKNERTGSYCSFAVKENGNYRKNTGDKDTYLRDDISLEIFIVLCKLLDSFLQHAVPILDFACVSSYPFAFPLVQVVL